MTPATAVPAARKKLLSKIAAIQRQVHVSKRGAKLAKAAFKAAKQKFKDAKRAAKKQCKELKALKAELAAHAAKQRPARKPAAKPAAKRVKPVQPDAAAEVGLDPVPAPAEARPAEEGTAVQ